MMRLVLVLIAVALAAPVAHAGPLRVGLDPVRIEAPRQDTLRVTGTLVNEGPDSLFVQGVVTDLSEALLPAEATFSMGPLPEALAPGEAWSGPLLLLLVAADAPLGSGVQSVSIVAGTSPSATAESAVAWFDLTIGEALVAVTPFPVVALSDLRVSPNPFTAGTAIHFTLGLDQQVDVRIYDVAGRSLRHLFAGVALAGAQRLSWDGRDDRGRRAGPGQYFVKVGAGQAIATARIVRTR
jgi:hypothetical protein